jgi:hypothetical protein
MESRREVAEAWYDRIEVIQHEHYLATLRFARLHYWVGIPLVLLTAIVGRCVFATPQQKRQASDRVAIGMLSVSATVLATLQTFLSYNERAEKHRMAGARYRALGWQLALMLAHDPGSNSMRSHKNPQIFPKRFTRRWQDIVHAGNVRVANEAQPIIAAFTHVKTLMPLSRVRGGKVKLQGFG